MPKLVTEAITELYQELDKHAEAVVKQFKATCTTGCDSCCYLLATITLAEGLLVAETILKKPDWYPLVPKLKDAALAYCFQGVNKATYLAKKIPCVFLDTEKRMCTIYQIRPGTCRYHYVISPPENCHPDHPIGRTGIINLEPLLEHVWSLSFAVASQNDWGDSIIAPLPMMVLFCMEKMAGEEGKGKRLLQEALKDLPTPRQFLELYHSSLIEDEIQRKPGTPEELEELRKGAT